MNMIEIEDLILSGETDDLIFIEDLSSDFIIARVINALANCSGGKVVIGIKKNKTIKGVNPFEFETYLNEVQSSYFNSVLKLCFETFQVKLKYVIILNVTSAGSRPLILNNNGSPETYIIKKGNVFRIHSKWVKALNQKLPSNKLNPSSIEEKILNIISDTTCCTINQLHKISSIHINQLEENLINLIEYGYVDLVYTNKSLCFVLS